MLYSRRLGLAATVAALFAAGAARAQDKVAEPDNGTDPTRVNRTLQGSYEYRDLGFGADTDRFKFAFTQPIGAHSSIGVTLPVESSTAFGDSDYDIGDIEMRVSKVFGLTRTHGYVVKGELTFDTAGRPELGVGQTVFEGTFIYAKFLTGGGIFAPSFAQSWGIDPEAGRARVNNLVLDFYYVPKLKAPNWYLTVDPAVVFDWDRGQQSGSFGVQLGHTAGGAFGGHGQVYVKPTTFIGAHRSADWGVEVGYKLIGF